VTATKISNRIITWYVIQVASSRLCWKVLHTSINFWYVFRHSVPLEMYIPAVQRSVTGLGCNVTVCWTADVPFTFLVPSILLWWVHSTDTCSSSSSNNNIGLVFGDCGFDRCHFASHYIPMFLLGDILKYLIAISVLRELCQICALHYIVVGI
jgi:hypothetical protein